MSESCLPQEPALEPDRVESDHELDPSEDIVQLLDRAGVHVSQREYAEAEPLLDRVLAWLTAQGDEGAQLVNVLGTLATVRLALGKHEAAEQLWRRSLAIRERVLEPYRFAIAQNLERLADACAAQGKVDEALPLLRRALDIGEHRLAATNATIANLRGKIADLVLRTSQPAPSLSIPLMSALSSPLSRIAGGESRDERTDAPRAPPLPAAIRAALRGRIRWHRLLGRGAGGAIDATAARVRRSKWPWLAILIGLAILLLLWVVGSVYRGGIARSPPSVAAAVQPIESKVHPPGVVTTTQQASRTAPRQPTAAVETGALRGADIKLADTDRAVRAAASIPAVSPQLTAALEATRRAAARQFAEANAQAVAPGRSSETGTEAGGRAGAVMRHLVGEPARPLAAALGDSSRPAAIAPGSPVPAYPPSLWSAGISGKVLVELLVDSSGRADLMTVDVLYSDNSQFTRAVRAALPKMQFIPAMLAGRPQAQLLRLPFVFAPDRRAR